METAAIVKTERYKAFAKEVEGVDLYWVPALKVAGIHQRGLANLLGCDEKTIRNAITRVKGADIQTTLSAVIVTSRGLQDVDIVAESALADVLEDLAFSRASIEARKNAIALLKRLATFGFKLMAMYHVVPEELCPELKPEPIAISPGRAALLAAGDDPIAIAKASREHFPGLATSMLPVEVHAAQIIEARRYVR